MPVLRIVSALRERTSPRPATVGLSVRTKLGRWGENEINSLGSLAVMSVRLHSQHRKHNDTIPSANHAIDNSRRRCILDHMRNVLPKLVVRFWCPLYRMLSWPTQL